MNDFELREKEMNHLVSERRRAWNKLAVGMIITGAVLFVAGGIFGSIVGDKYEEKIDVMEADTQSEEYSAENIKDVNIDVGVGNVTLVKSADDKVHVNGMNVPNDYNVETSGGVLNIRVVNDNVGPFDWDDSMQLTIELPEKEYESFSVDAGAGEFYAYDVTCGKADINVGAGDATLTSFTCKDGVKLQVATGHMEAGELKTGGTLEAKVGVGEINIESAATSGLKVDVGVGNLVFSGNVKGNIDAKCGVGNCDIFLENTKADFEKNNYRVNTQGGIGDLDINYADEE